VARRVGVLKLSVQRSAEYEQIERLQRQQRTDVHVLICCGLAAKRKPVAEAAFFLSLSVH
jgi:hypothetical protein